jgi:hypothetical protein
MKEYFSHDYNARNDRKLTNLAMIRKMEGIGVYWCILEMMYENDGILPTEYARIAFELRTDNDLIKSVVNDFELFIIDGDTFYSESVNSRLKIRTDKSVQARENVQKRWDKYKGNTPVIQSNEVGNTIKVKKSKVKDIKEKESKEDKERDFRKQVFSFKDKYSDKMLLAFFNYWSEKSKSGRMRWEMEKTYEIEKRLVTWKSREKEEPESKPYKMTDFYPSN